MGIFKRIIDRLTPQQNGGNQDKSPELRLGKYNRLLRQTVEGITDSVSSKEIISILDYFCRSLETSNSEDDRRLGAEIRNAIPLIDQIQFVTENGRVSAQHSSEIEIQLTGLIPQDLLNPILARLVALASSPVRPNLVGPEEAPEAAPEAVPSFDSTGSLGPDLKKLNELKDSGRLSAEQVSDRIEGFIAKIDSLDALAQYVGGSEESPLKQPIIKAKSFSTDPSKKLSELQEYLNSLDSSTGNRLLIVRRVKILAVQEWHKRHSIGVEGGKQLDPKLVSEFRSIFDGLRKDSYSPEDITEIVRIIDLLISRLGNSAFSTEELERFKDRFTFFLNKDYTLSYERDVDAPHGFGLGFLFNSIFNYIKLNGLSPEKPDQASIEQRVSSATSIDQIITIVRELGSIPSSSGGSPIPAQEVIDSINAYMQRSRDKFSLPRFYNIRGKVEELRSKL